MSAEQVGADQPRLGQRAADAAVVLHAQPQRRPRAEEVHPREAVGAAWLRHRSSRAPCTHRAFPTAAPRTNRHLPRRILQKRTWGDGAAIGPQIHHEETRVPLHPHRRVGHAAHHDQRAGLTQAGQRLLRQWPRPQAQLGPGGQHEQQRSQRAQGERDETHRSILGGNGVDPGSGPVQEQVVFGPAGIGGNAHQSAPPGGWRCPAPSPLSELFSPVLKAFLASSLVTTLAIGTPGQRGQVLRTDSPIRRTAAAAR